MTNKLAIVFPGQGSQSVGMLAGLAETHGVVRETFDEGSAALGLDLWRMSQEGPKEALDQTHNTQPALLCAGVAVWRVLEREGFAVPAVMAGHSLGEYTALVAAGAGLPLADAVRLVATRGRLMQEAVPAGTGAMAAILGLDDAQVVAVCEEAAQGEVVVRGQLQLARPGGDRGHAAAVERAAGLAKAAGAKRALMLDVSVPSHCALMHPAAQRLAAVLEELSLDLPKVPVLHNVTVQAAADPAAIRRLLVEQLYSPVRWVETVQAMAALGVGTVIEAGPGKVLAGLIKRIDKSLNVLPVADPAGLETARESLHA
jgi:[acyl-carrier-protein] S-malonyltransferase